MGQFIGLDIVDENGIKYQTLQIFEKSGVYLPSGVLENLDAAEAKFVVYGQQEMFDEKGFLNFGQTAKPKIVFLAKALSILRLQSGLNTWETTMADDLKNLFNIDPKKATSQIFLDNIYRSANVRYRNFPFADSTIDYATLNLSEFKADYFVLTNSREGIYSAIDLLIAQ